MRLSRRNNDSQSQGVGKRHDAHSNCRYLPSQAYGLGLMALRPEEVEEEGRAEDGGNGDADEDVVGCDAKEVVVVFDGEGVKRGDEILLVDIV